MQPQKKHHQDPYTQLEDEVLSESAELDIVDVMNNNQKPPISKRRKILRGILVFALIVEVVVLVGFVVLVRMNFFSTVAENAITPPVQNSNSTQSKVETGKILLSEPVSSFTPEQTTALIKQANASFALPVTTGMQKQLIRYTSSDGKSNDIPVYARVYFPTGASSAKKLPVLAFAPGTTGVGDDCAASLEQPAKRNWSNYDSLMAAYASQGYVVVITDYQGMRDPNRIHSYMIGEPEGKAMLDSIRAVRNLDTTKSFIDSDELFVAGYSQGGHAAYWADMLAADYAPDLKLNGAIGFGPVTSVEQTLTDAITNSANINWFGPYILTSYQAWYRQNLNPDKVLLPQWNKNLRVDSLRECVDTVNKYWPNNVGANRSALLYTPEFIEAVRTNTLATNPSYKAFAADLAKNIVGEKKTSTPKLLNQGMYDNVVLSKQNKAGFKRFCKSGNKIMFREYDKSPLVITQFNPTGAVDHYNTMNASLNDTIAWMQAISAGGAATTNCQ